MLGKDCRRPREIDERDCIFDARPKTAREAAEEMIRDMKEMPEPLDSVIAQTEDLVRQAHDYEPLYYDGQQYVRPRGRPIDRIAEMIRDLTYGEMIELATEIWACRGDGIEQQGLPETLHRWAKSYT